MDYRKLFAGFPPDAALYGEPLSGHTSFRIGGPADAMLLPRTAGQLQEAVRLARENGIDYFIMGNGSNLLALDGGYRGVIIKTERLSAVTADGTALYAEAGAALARAASVAMSAGLAGFEFASGIPGSLGGAVCMNAGAYGGEMKDVLESAEVLGEHGGVFTLSAGELGLSYRASRVQREGLVVLSARLSLRRGDISEIKALSKRLNDSRREKQPLEYPSAGSVFKRPEGHFAGKLIMDAGLAGFSVGGAMVSPRHCGFIVNTGGASSGDVLGLIAHITAAVKDKYGIGLETEVKLLS